MSIVAEEDMFGVDFTDRLKGFITEICETIGPRLGTSDAERKAGERIRAEYEKYCDETYAEEFSCHPGAFLDCVRVTIVLFALGVVLYLWFPLATVILGVIGLLIYAAEVLYLKEVVDPLFPKRTGVNIYGKIKSKKQPRRIVLISGHHDSAYEFPLFNRIGLHRAPTFVMITIGLAVVSLILAFTKVVVTFIFSPYVTLMNWLFIIPIISLTLLLVVGFRLRSNKVVLGANDNLSGVAVTLGVGEWLVHNPRHHTEVWLVSFACEENMRGSMRFAERHQEELQDAYLLNFDMVGIGSLQIVTAESMFHATMTPEVYEKVTKAAQTAGLYFPLKKLPFAGTDASNFIHAGLKAASISAVFSEKVPNYWHSLEDTPDKLDAQVMLTAIKAAIAFIDNIDKESS